MNDTADSTVTGAERLYLDLIKQTLSFSLWPEPPAPIEARNSSRPALARFFVSGIAAMFRPLGLQLVSTRQPDEQARAEGRVWPGYADTMIGRKRLDNLQSCVESVLTDGVEGDFIETGVWRGGSCIFMRAILAAHGVHDRKVFVADSFAGLPAPDADKYPEDRGDTHHIHADLAISQQQVAANFEKYGLLDEQVVFLKGWFKDTLPSAPIEKLAVLRLDGDMYESTMDALTSLYPKLSAGGYCIVDDYSLPNCRQAIHDYRQQHGIEDEIEQIDWTGSYWRKSQPAG